MASDDEILERLLAHLEPMAGPEVTLDEETHLTTTLGLDSHKVMDLVMDVEDEFDILVPMNELADVETAGDLASLIHRLSEE